MVGQKALCTQLEWICWMEPWIPGAGSGQVAAAHLGVQRPLVPIPGNASLIPTGKAPGATGRKSWCNRESQFHPPPPKHQSHSRLVTSVPFTAQLRTLGGHHVYAFYPLIPELKAGNEGQRGCGQDPAFCCCGCSNFLSCWARVKIIPKTG